MYSSYSPSTDPLIAAFFALHHGLPRQGPGSDATTRYLLTLAGPLPDGARVLDAGCGPGRSALLLAAEAGAQVTAVDLHQPFLDELTAEAARRGLGERITTVNRSMDQLPFPDRTFDLIWAEGSVFTVGFDTALGEWHRLLAPGGALVVTEAEWSTRTPSPQALAFWARSYPLRTAEENAEAAGALGYDVMAHWPLPEEDWWADYYSPLAARLDAADTTRTGMAEAVAATREEIALRRDHGGDYRYAGYVLRPSAHTGLRHATHSAHQHSAHQPTHANGTAMSSATWTTRTERRGSAEDAAAIREITLAAFPTSEEADLVDALRADGDAWMEGFSFVSVAPDGTLAGHALLTRCHVEGEPALALAPCAVLPAHQKTGAGSAAIRAALEGARAQGENLVLVLGHPEYYPRFGFTPASRLGIRAPMEVPDEAMLALALDPARPVPSGVIQYAAPFGI